MEQATLPLNLSMSSRVQDQQNPADTNKDLVIHI